MLVITDKAIIFFLCLLGTDSKKKKLILQLKTPTCYSLFLMIKELSVVLTPSCDIEATGG